MLRAIVVLLLIVNALFLAWHQGWMSTGAAAPSRLEQQVRPEQLKLLGQKAATQLSKVACVELGPLETDDALRQTTALLTRSGVPNGAWEAQSTASGGTWALATIKMPSKEFQARKEDTYRSARIAFEPLQGFPDEQPTLVLSRHDSEAAAQAALDGMSKRNYKGLRVLRLQAPTQHTTLRLPRVDGLQLARLDAVANPPWGANRKSCEVAAASPAGALVASAPAVGASGAPATK
ncbi:hypothetical protein SAMN05216359_107226 [Roseateles sp. YR242]|uniref:hypothetical protein n=1 Tax=Roseateles sp. YR242 TaxID=1855305 RepID=UPI0008B9831E|nr:hypothetical protein [Roseateles sp. YR242]SEL32486.1 hypothetical protein SAMN05216359_107226 [Roseateles sp. YR242]